MKRKILSGLVGVAMLGAAAGANAFIFNAASYDLNGASMAITGLPVGAASPNGAFSVAIDLGTGANGMYPLPAAFGNSSITTGLVGMTAGQSVYAGRVIVDGAVGLDNPLTAGIDSPHDYNDYSSFLGVMTTTLDTLSIGALPGVLDSTTASFSGSMHILYNGTFSNFPLLQVGGAGSGRLDIGFNFDSTSDILTMSIVESLLTWDGFEDALDNLDGAFGGADDGVVGAYAYAGQSITPNGQGGYNSAGLLNVTAVPEPASLALLGIGIAGLGFMRRRKA